MISLRSIRFALLSSLLAAGAFAESATDPFERLKADLSSSDCIRLEFISVVSSEVFESVDSVAGSALVAADGRFRIRLGPDWFVQDSASLYSFNAAQNQITIERRPPDSASTLELTFLTRLDQWFDSRILQARKSYLLVRKPASPSSLPDSLTLGLTNGPQRLEQVAFVDENGDAHTIWVRQLTLNARCRSNQFVPDIPDSADVVRLP